MDAKKEHIARLAATLNRSNNTMDGKSLANNLNSAGFTTYYGEPYSGERGIYTLIHATYDSLVSEGRQLEADIVAQVYRNSQGGHAWIK